MRKTEPQAGATSGKVRYFTPSRKQSWLHAIALNAALIAIPCAVYYFINIRHAAEYDSDRAFRALVEVQAQFDQYLTATDNLPLLADAQIISEQPSPEKAYAALRLEDRSPVALHPDISLGPLHHPIRKMAVV